MSFRITLGIISFIAALHPAHAQGTGTLNGEVTGITGEPMFGANVAIRGASLDAPMGTVTGSDGGYVVTAVPAGTYEVHVTHIGYRAAIQEVLIEAGGAHRLDFTLASTVIYLEQNVVSASRTQAKALDAPASVAVVEASEIRDNPVLTVADHVKDLPGVDFAQTGLVTSNVVVRGFNNIFSGALLTLTDNRIARVPSLRLNANNFIPVTNDDIERIEVVLGPGSALYGPNSANGVMHVITRSPFVSGGTDVSIGFGERSLRKGSVRHAGAINSHLGYKVSAQYYVGTDWKFNDPVEEAARAKEAAEVEDPAMRILKPRDFDLERQSVEARLDYRPAEDMTAILSYGYNKGDHIELTGLGAGQVIDWNYNYVQARFIYADLFAQYFHNWSDAGDTFLLATGDKIVDKSSLDVFQVQHATELGRKERLTYGVDVLLTRPKTEGTITGQNENDDDVNEFGVYVQSETDLTEQLDLVLALRYDDHNRVKNSVLSPRAALLYKPSQSQTVRLTYNRAFSTPTTNNLYLDRVASRDPFGLGSGFQPTLGFAPTIDVMAQGTYRKDDTGLTFRRGEDGNPLYRTPFSSLIAGQLAALEIDPGTPGYSIGNDGYIRLDDPIATGVLWNVGRGAVLAGFTDAFMAAAPLLQLSDEQAADALAQFDKMVPTAIPDLATRTLSLNQAKAADRATYPFPFDPADPLTDVVDVRLTEPTITQTIEVGYKGIVGGNIVVAADFYRTETEDFVGPLAVETPNVFLDPVSLTVGLEAGLREAFADEAYAEVVPILGAVDNPALGLGGDGDGDPVPELTALFVQGAELGGEAKPGAAFIPLGTISPVQAYDPHAVILTYRNFGDVTLYGVDLSAGYYPNDIWNVTGSYSFVDDDFFANLGGIADVALNAPKHKFRVGGQYRMPAQNLRLGARLRHNGSFPMKSGVYEGKVKSYTVVDLSAAYDLPYGENLSLIVNVDNVLNDEFRAFVGAPEVGRLAYAQLGVSF